ncbi:DUF6328 family protein [Kitasatospora herbaricolor]
MLQEVRVSQTGGQILFGFLISVAFMPRFAALPDFDKSLYVAAVVLGAQHRCPALVRRHLARAAPAGPSPRRRTAACGGTRQREDLAPRGERRRRAFKAVRLPGAPLPGRTRRERRLRVQTAGQGGWVAAVRTEARQSPVGGPDKEAR